MTQHFFVILRAGAPLNLALPRDLRMNLAKSKKRIAKKVKMGFKGYPVLSITYSGQNPEVADEVIITFVSEEEAEPMEEKFRSKSDVREDEVIQSAIVKMIERSEVKSVILAEGVSIRA